MPAQAQAAAPTDAQPADESAPNPAPAPASPSQPQVECEVAKDRFQQGTQANKTGDFVDANANFTQGLTTARTVELKSALLVSRSAALCGMVRFSEALADAENCILIRKSWSRSYRCQATALEGLGRMEEAERTRRLAAALESLKNDPKNEVCFFLFPIALAHTVSWAFWWAGVVVETKLGFGGGPKSAETPEK